MRTLALALALALATLPAGPALAKGKAPDVPANVRAEAAKSGILVTWSPVPGAKGYYIHRTTEKSDADFAKIASVKNPSFQDKTATGDDVYLYYVIAYNDAGASDRSELARAESGRSATEEPAGAAGKAKGYFVGFEAWRKGNRSVNECALIKFEDRSIWISHADQKNPDYPPMVNCGALPTFPGRPNAAAMGFGINESYRFCFFYEPDGSGTVFIASSKHSSSWTEWSSIGELPTPAGYAKGRFKFAFGVSPTYFCCVALDTKTMQTYEATCHAGGKSWSPWKACGKISQPRFLKGDYFWSVAYDDGVYYGVMQQPTTNAFWYNVFTGASWTEWKEGAQKPPMPEWVLR